MTVGGTGVFSSSGCSGFGEAIPGTTKHRKCSKVEPVGPAPEPREAESMDSARAAPDKVIGGSV